MPAVHLNCLLRSETENNIFAVEIDNNLTVNNLKYSIRNAQQDLRRQVNFDLYEIIFPA